MADLVAGGVITAIGALSVGNTRRARDLPLAALPLVLGAHQLIESVVWRNADADGMGTMDGVTHSVGGTAVLLWAIIAFPLLPAFVPLAVMCAANSWARLRILPFAAIGLASSAVLAYALASGPVTATPVGHTMRYGIHHVPLETVVVVGYLVATLGALLGSDQQEIRLLGFVAGVGALICFVLWEDAFASSWCAVAAVCTAEGRHGTRRARTRRAAPDPLRRSRIPAR